MNGGKHARVAGRHRQTAAYSASKAALISPDPLTRARGSRAGRRARVNAVAPGVIDTDMVRVLRQAPGASCGATQPHTAPEAQLSSLRELHPLHRLGTPDEVAQAVLFLIGAKFVTGTVLVADGGLLLGGA